MNTHTHPHTKATSKLPNKRQLQAWVIDDFPVVRNYVSTVFRRQRVHVTELASGIAVLQSVRNITQIDLIFIDMSLPDIDSFWLIQHLKETMRQANCAVPIIANIATIDNATNELHKRCQRVGAQAVYSGGTNTLSKLIRYWLNVISSARSNLLPNSN